MSEFNPVAATVEGFRLSPQQERLWRLQQAGEFAAYRSRGSLLVEGTLDLDTLEAAVLRTVQRHEILRTRFKTLSGMTLPVQVLGEAALSWREPVDLADLPAEERAVRAAALFAAVGESSSLDEGPLLSVQPVRLAADRHLLLLGLPALAADGAGLANLAREIGAAYAALREPVGGRSAGRLPEELEEPEEPLQYVEAADFLVSLLAAPESAPGRAYWQELDLRRLADLALPLSRHRVPGVPGVPGLGRVAVALGARLSAGLEELARRWQVPLKAAVLTLWMVFLRRLAERPEMGVALLSAGRKYEGLGQVPGLFARHLPVVLELGLAEGLPEVARRLGEQMTRVHRLEDYFDWSGLTSVGDGAPGFLPAAFELIEETPPWNAGGLEWRIERLDSVVDRFALRLSCRQGRTLGMELDYDGAEFATAEVARLAARFLALQASAVENSRSAVGDLALLDAVERHQLVREQNDTATRPGGPSLLHVRFALAAARNPERIAVEADHGQLSYAELDRRSSRLARFLRRQGIAPESRVAVCLERSLDLVIALLGVQKAGAAWVPLDPEAPAERLAAMLEGARPALVLTAERLADRFSAPGLQRLSLDTAAAPFSREEPADPGVAVAPENLAYILYTSGSTGRPKGVMVAHGAIANRLDWMLGAFPLTAAERVLQKTPVTFDAAIWELFVPLWQGARLVLARPGGHADLAYLVSVVRERGITVLQVVPSILRLLLREPGIEACSTLRWVFCGGEALDAGLRQRFRDILAPSTRRGPELGNLYGPTEVAIDATFERRAETATADGASIGRPLGNVEVHLLDAGLGLSPWEMTGELLIGGAGLARGYLGQPGLTAERFLPDPWSGRPGARLYRSGDLARRRCDGTIEYLGRADRQVKVHGVRVEPEEVEVALALHHGVRQAAVVGRVGDIGGIGDIRLVAYVVLEDREAPTAVELRCFLAARLPEPMLPAVFVSLPALPRLTNGKIDRQALPEPMPEEVAPGGEAATPVERLVTAIWAEVLGVERVSRGDNFFALGGNSLVATQVFSRLRRSLHLEVPLRSLFEVPTAAAFAAHIETALRGGADLVAPPIEPAPRDRPLPLSFAQQRLWFFELWAPGGSLFQITNAFRVHGRFDEAAFARSVDEAVRRHESLRTTFREVDGEPEQVVHPAAPSPLPILDLRGLPVALREAELERQFAREVRQPFDLIRGPLLRLQVLRLAEEESAVLLTLHHIVSDAWSMGILVRELVTDYAAFVASAAGRRSLLPEPALQYPDFACWQRRWLAGEVLESHLLYWRRHLAGVPALLALPADRPRPTVPTFRGAKRSWLLPMDRLAELNAFGLREGLTLFMLLLAAFAVLLREMTGQEDFVVGTDVANRNRIETEGLIGFFINQLALRCDVSGDPTFRELMGRVREAVLGGYAHQDLPFERLVEAINPERSLHHAPLFQLKMNLHNVPRVPLELPGLRLEPMVVPRGIAQLDLILNLVETEEGLQGGLEYNAHLFEAARMDRMLAGFERILAVMVAHPESHLGELDSPPTKHSAPPESGLAQARLRTFESARRKSVQAGTTGG
jgi:amino acid adenylation domain-containing protein